MELRRIRRAQSCEGTAKNGTAKRALRILRSFPRSPYEAISIISILISLLNITGLPVLCAPSLCTRFDHKSPYVT